jgi:hypothetical protein
MTMTEFKQFRTRLAELSPKQIDQLRKELEQRELLRRIEDVQKKKNLIRFTPEEWEEYGAEHRLSR